MSTRHTKVKRPKTPKTRAGRYRTRGGSDIVLPHAVEIVATTLPRVGTRPRMMRWRYHESFRVAQFPSRAAAESAVTRTLEMMRPRMPAGLVVRRSGLGVTISGATPRGAFADMMVGEFLAWEGDLGKLTLARFLSTAVRFAQAGAL